MNREDDDQLWDLLGSAPAPVASPFFARNVLRKIRRESRWKAFWQSWFSWHRLAPASGLAMMALAAAFFLRTPAHLAVARSGAADPAAIGVAAQDYEVVANLDELLASEENSLWTDNSSL